MHSRLLWTQINYENRSSHVILPLQFLHLVSLGNYSFNILVNYLFTSQSKQHAFRKSLTRKFQVEGERGDDFFLVLICTWIILFFDGGFGTAVFILSVKIVEYWLFNSIYNCVICSIGSYTTRFGLHRMLWVQFLILVYFFIAPVFRFVVIFLCFKFITLSCIIKLIGNFLIEGHFCTFYLATFQFNLRLNTSFRSVPCRRILMFYFV